MSAAFATPLGPLLLGAALAIGAAPGREGEPLAPAAPRPRSAAGSPPRSSGEGFPAFVWRSAGAPSDEQQRALLTPFGGAQVNGADEAEWLRGAGLDFFVFNAPGRDVLHLERVAPAYRARWKAWYEDRDDVFLTREPCLTEPATRSLLFELLGASLGARGGDTGRGVSLGDEVSLTPGGGPEDVCLSPTCRRAWASFLAEHRELTESDREALADPARFSTDRARQALAEGDTSLLHGWLLRREFHQQVVSDLLAELERASRARAPLAPVGLLGLAGQTAFGNVAVERVLPFLDFIECYPVSNGRELACTLRDAGQQTWATVFIDAELPNRASWQAWMHWIRGGDGLVVWSERELAALPQVSTRLARTLADIRRLRAAFPEFRPRPGGVAIVHSPRSVAASWLRDALLDGPTWPKRLAGFHEENGTLERSLDAWLRFFEDQGVMPGALPFEQLDAGTVPRFPTLVLNHALVVDERELARLHEYLDAGGTVLVHGDLGWLDGRGRPRERPLLRQLLEASPRVLVAPDIVDEYPSTRTRRTHARREVLERRLWSYLNSIRANIDRAPFALRGDHAEDLPWISAWGPHRASGGWICAALPNAVGLVEKKRLENEIPVRVQATAGFEVQWVHPEGPLDETGRMRLPPGDAAVFLLVPERSGG